MLTKTTLLCLALLAGLVHILITATPSLAESGIRVTPTHLSPTIAVGDETREVITLQNLSDRETILRSQVSIGAGESAVMPEVRIEPQEVTLGPGQSQPVTVSISVPADMTEGRRQATVIFDTGPAAGGDVAIVGRVAVLIDINVIRPVSDVTWNIPHFINSSDTATFAVQAVNSGNFPTQLVENVELAGITGSVNLESRSRQVQVGERVNLETVWEETPLLAFKIATVSVGSSVGAPVHARTLFVIFPWKLSLALIVFVTIALIGVRISPFFAKVFR
ncbi:MAG: hypothetical protein ACYCXF_02845 [Thermoleophilia bacterium]